MSKLLID